VVRPPNLTRRWARLAKPRLLLRTSRAGGLAGEASTRNRLLGRGFFPCMKLYPSILCRTGCCSSTISR
jgi:hypothetical protein